MSVETSAAGRSPLNVMLWYWGRRGFPVRMTADLIRALSAREKVRVTASLSRQSEGFQPSDLPAEEAFDVDTFVRRRDILGGLAKLPRQLRQLLKFVDQNDVHVVVAIMRHPFGPLVFPSLRRHGKRVILIVHDALPHAGDRFPFWHSHFRGELRATDGIIVMSDAVAEAMQRCHHYPLDRIFRMPLPAPDYPNARGPRSAPVSRPWRLLFFGRILRYKGLQLLTEAYLSLQKRFAVTLQIVGHGTSEELDRLARLPAVSIRQGWVPEEEVPAVLDGADLLVLPYIDASQSGVILSGFAMGLPAVSTPVGGIREQLSSGVNGIMARETSSAALAEAIEQLISNAQLYESCSRGAVESATGNFSPSRAADAIVEACLAVRKMPPCQPSLQARSR